MDERERYTREEKDELHPTATQYIMEQIRALRKRQAKDSQDIKCLYENLHKYKPLLDELQDSKNAFQKLRYAVLEKLVTAILWIVLAFLCVAAWEYVKSTL